MTGTATASGQASGAAILSSDRMIGPEMIVRRPLEVQTIRQGLVVPLEPTREPDAPMFRGGAYDRDGEFVGLSGSRRLFTEVIGPCSAEEVRGLEPVEDAGEAVFCGPLMDHFGHILLESTARLWWGISRGWTGKYAFAAPPGFKVPAAAAEIFHLLGIHDRVVVVTAPIRFSRLVVPETAISLQRWVHHDFLVPFATIRQAIKAAGPVGRARKLLLSRARLEARQGIGEADIEAILRHAGYQTVWPETLALREQIRLILGAEEIAGIIGSAMHLLVFHSQAEAFYIQRMRRLNLNYPLVDVITGTRGRYVPAVAARSETLGKPNRGSGAPVLLEPELYRAGLEACGFDCSAVAPPPREALERAFLATWYRNRGNLQRKRNRTREALQDFALAVALDPRDRATREQLATILADEGLLDEARILRAALDSGQLKANAGNDHPE